MLHCRDVKFHEYEQETDPEVDTNSEPVYRLVLDFSDDCETLNTDKNQLNSQALIHIRMRKKTSDFHGNSVNLSTENSKEPRTTEEASTCPEKLEWMAAMEAEMKLLFDNKV